MRLARIELPDGIFQARVDGDLLLAPGEARLPGVSDAPLSRAVPLSAARLLAPVRPSKIPGIGRNYVLHAKELGNDVPSRPLMFMKAPSTVIGPGETILLPPDSKQVDHEAELALVIGTRCRHVRPEDWRRVVFGFTCINDVTARDLQRKDVQFGRAKNFDTFSPIGPWVETDLDPNDLAVTCRVDGVVRQAGRTKDLLFAIPTLVASVSRILTLQPGDIIATGTPDGVGPLPDGCVVEVEVEGIGVLRNPVRSDDVPDLGPPIGRC